MKAGRDQVFGWVGRGACMMQVWGRLAAVARVSSHRGRGDRGHCEDLHKEEGGTQARQARPICMSFCDDGAEAACKLRFNEAQGPPHSSADHNQCSRSPSRRVRAGGAMSCRRRRRFRLCVENASTCLNSPGLLAGCDCSHGCMCHSCMCGCNRVSVLAMATCLLAR